MLHRDVISGRAFPLLVLLMLEAGRYLFDFVKFRREASYHMWGSKLWGLVLFAAFFSVLVLSGAGIAVDMAICIGMLADLKGLMISIALRQWQSDVPTIFHALRIRNEARASNLLPA